MTDHSRSAPATHLDADRERENQALRARMSRVHEKLLVLSGKGGVGKSTVAANLAVALAAAGSTVGLLDVDMHGPSIPKLLGMEGRQPQIYDGLLDPVTLNERLKVISIGFFLPDERTPVIWRGPRKFNAIRQFLKDVDWGELDYLVVDAPPGTGDEPLAVAELIGQPSRAVLVTTPQELAVADVRRCVSFCRSLQVEIAGIVENMSGLICPHCGQRVELFQSGGGWRLAQETGVPLLGMIPFDPNVAQRADQGRSLSDTSPEDPVARAFATIVAALTGRGPEHAQATTVSSRTPTEKTHMTIAVPADNRRVSAHFGHCPAFELYEVDEATKTVRAHTTLPAPPHEPGLLPRWLHERGANVIITGGMGKRAQVLFAQHGIRVVVGAPPDLTDDVVAAYLAGSLQAGTNACDH